MPEPVIVDAIRTPIGRAGRGSLKSVRADDLAALPIRALVERNPTVDFAQTTTAPRARCTTSTSRWG
jgi:acetyl-CoA C-acetyltransferase